METMKKAILITALIALAIIVHGQAPQAFNYQAILRNTDGSVQANKSIVLQISLVDDLGNSVYSEIHNTQTNLLGLINVVIGKGSSSDDLSLVDWSTGPYFLEIVIDGTPL